jgi:sortase A
MPGRPDNCVLAGHRDTVLAGVGALKKGDLLVVETDAGIFTYAITRTRIVHKDDRTIIVPTDHAVLTVSTCYPFHFIGNAPDRYIISADLVTAAGALTPAR